MGEDDSTHTASVMPGGGWGCPTASTAQHDSSGSGCVPALALVSRGVGSFVTNVCRRAHPSVGSRGGPGRHSVPIIVLRRDL